MKLDGKRYGENFIAPLVCMALIMAEFASMFF